MATSRGIEGMNTNRRRPVLETFKRLYVGNQAFSGLFDVAILGGITLLFLNPHALLFFRPSPHVAGASSTAPPSPPPPLPSATTTAPSTSSAAPVAPPAVRDTPQQTKPAVVLVKTPPWPRTPLVALREPSVPGVPMSFPSDLTNERHPPSRIVLVDERAFASRASDTKAKLGLALKARADQRGSDMLAALADADQADSAVQMLTGLALILANEPGSPPKAEAKLRAAMAGGATQAATFLGILLTSTAKGLSGSSDEGHDLLAAAAESGERVAILIAALGNLSGEFGTIDMGKAADQMRTAAEMGEPLALMHFAHFAHEGIGIAKDLGLAEAALRRAADLGLTEAEMTLGRWIVTGYQAKKITDPSEGVTWLERARAKGDMQATATLGYLYSVGGLAPPWKDVEKGFALLGECARAKIASCNNNLGSAYQFGRGTTRDIVSAWAYYDVGRHLNTKFVMPQMAALDQSLLPDEKARAHDMSSKLLAASEPRPQQIVLRPDH